MIRRAGPFCKRSGGLEPGLVDVRAGYDMNVLSKLSSLFVHVERGVWACRGIIRVFSMVLIWTKRTNSRGKYTVVQMDSNEPRLPTRSSRFVIMSMLSHRSVRFPNLVNADRSHTYSPSAPCNSLKTLHENSSRPRKRILNFWGTVGDTE